MIQRKENIEKDEYALITPTLQDGNDLIDKHFLDSHHIKSIYFDDADKYDDGFDMDQDEHYSKIIRI